MLLNVCAECLIEMRPKKNSVYVVEMASFGPAAIWSADLWACPVCGHETLTGFGFEPVVEHYEARFHEVLEMAKASRHSYWIKG